MTDERDIDRAAMRRAIDEAARTRPSPNPPVGALVLSPQGEVLAVEAHERAGEPHAEVKALRAAGETARGGTLYVTLEPCNHHGRTPPCVDAILEAGVRRVVIGCADPNPHVTGGGARRLAEAGVQVDVGVLDVEARRLIAHFTKFVTTGHPHVSLKLALTLDGRIATKNGDSKWVTGDDARRKVQYLRAQHDAVAVGLGTVKADNPRLTLRKAQLLDHVSQPLRVVYDSKARLEHETLLVQTARDFPLLVLVGDEAPGDAVRELTDLGCDVARVATSPDGRIDVVASLDVLAAQGITSILFEGGAELAGSLLAARIVDELHAFIAATLFGPRGRPGAVDWAGPDFVGEAPHLLDPTWETCGRDAYVRGRVAFPPKASLP